MKPPNPRCFGVWGGIGRKAEVQNPNGVSAECAILPNTKSIPNYQIVNPNPVDNTALGI
jgi:hypothetical protein